jgi:hypothetical protein
VESVTMAKLIHAILDAVGFRDLDRTEQGVIMDIIVGRYERDFQRKAARRIVRGYTKINPAPLGNRVHPSQNTESVHHG